MNRSKVISSLLWKLLERGGTQGIQFIVQIILARLLLPEMYGTVALVTVFITLAQVFVQSGLGTALIQKKEADNVDFSSVFYLSLGLAGVLYTLLFIFAPVISRFYHDAELIPVLRVLGIILFFGAVNGIQNAWVSRHMMFKELFKRSIGALLISGTAGIIAAYAGLDIWALVIQQLTNQAAVTVIMWFTVKWRPIRAFSLDKVKALFSFGWKLLLSSLLDQLYRDLRTLVIGRIYSSSTLGFYNKGEQFPKIIVSNINGSIQAVMLPALSAHQDDRQRVKAMMRRAIKTSSFIMFPMMVGMAVVAEPMVRLLLTEKWLPAVPFLQVFCFTYMLWPIHTANLQAINALGRSDIFLKLEIIKKIVGIVILVVSVPMGVYAIALGGVVSGISSSFINAWPNKKLLNYSYAEQLKDIAPALGLSLLMGAIVYLVGTFPTADWQKLMVQVPVGAVAYIIASKIAKVESMHYLHNVLKSALSRKA
ncbi:MAG: lipopolysaccharide biosynthesis protein [Spirochaetales bacterium]|nr:lipopolysaccharide biosynthesis protein [Spirochaetales bacterium]